ncbi:MAG: glycoside hydrolase family 27 protein [Solirubrobacteraceae bacterium]
MRIAVATMVVGCVLGVSSAPADATVALSWSEPFGFDEGNTPSAVSCVSESLCVAVDREGNELTSVNPAASNPSWSRAKIAGVQLNAVSCAPSGPCAAVDEHGHVLVDAQPGISGWSSTTIDGTPLTGIACPGGSLCIAVDESGNVLSSENPTANSASAWHTATIDSGHKLRAVSCASRSLCAAVDEDGQVLWSTEPAGGATAWHLRRIDFVGLSSVSCYAAAAPVCVTVDESGDALASADLTTPAPTWSLAAIDSEPLLAVSCASSGMCVALDKHGHALASDDLAAAAPAWSSSSGNPDQSSSSIACSSGGLCVVVDQTGRSLVARVPAPSATTLAPTEVRATTAILAAAVSPNDAALTECELQYGTSTSYTQSAPCSPTPSANGGTQDVGAAVSALEPNTTYHYRVIATTPRGQSAGADQAFTTAVSSEVAIVHPNPTISGTPGVGQTLTCHPGISSETGVQLAYAWLRDQIPIPENSYSTYTVRGQDSGHHLQCQVTATNGSGSASTKSGFVTIPSGSGVASAGETTIGKASVRGTRVGIPITCSPLAGSGGCRITARVSVAETLSRRRIVAVAARANGHDKAAGTHRVTVTLASARTRLGAGAHSTVVLALTNTGKRLLAARHGFKAALTVSGTVVGVIEAQLSRQTLAFGNTTHSASTHRATRSVSTRYASARGASTHGVAARMLAATPYMGWDTYFALGGTYSEATVLQQASQLISLGLQKHGYRYVWLDVGWWHGTRNAASEITVSAKQWPRGLAWLTRTLHAAGFLVGLYTDAGPNGCGGAGEGSYGHYQKDANTFAAWGFDAVKVDFCGGEEHHLNPQVAYAEFHAALANNSSHRSVLLSICDFLQPEQYGEGRPLLNESAFSSYTFGPSVGNSWRTDTDVGAPGKVLFANVLRNMDADAADPLAAGPGHWNDPDYLAPGQGMSATQFRTQFSMWAMLAAPLMVSDDLTKLGPSSLSTLQDSEAIAIDQDPAGVQGTLLSTSGNAQVWVKPLLGGERAVALLNRGSSATQIETSASAAGLAPARSYTVRNVWTHSRSITSGAIAAKVPGDGIVLVRVAGQG